MNCFMHKLPVGFIQQITKTIRESLLLTLIFKTYSLTGWNKSQKPGLRLSELQFKLLFIFCSYVSDICQHKYNLDLCRYCEPNAWKTEGILFFGIIHFFTPFIYHLYMKCSFVGGKEE